MIRGKLLIDDNACKRRIYIHIIYIYTYDPVASHVTYQCQSAGMFSYFSINGNHGFGSFQEESS